MRTNKHRNKHSLFLSLAFAFALLTSCGSSMKYSSDNLIDLTSIHQQIAILPVKTNSGNPSEAIGYQMNLYHALLRQTQRTVKVPLQPVKKTNAILQENNISLHKVWEMEPKKLASLLGVDAVVKLKITEESLIEEKPVGTALAANEPSDLFDIQPAISGNAKAVASIYDTETGELLWKLNVSKQKKQNNFQYGMIDRFSKKIAKNFPYKWE